MPGNHDCAKYAQNDLEKLLKVILLESAMLLLKRKAKTAVQAAACFPQSSFGSIRNC
jgi:hypothetical protein